MPNDDEQTQAANPDHGEPMTQTTPSLQSTLKTPTEPP